jgi:membrane protein
MLQNGTQGSFHIMATMWKLGGLTWMKLAKRVWTQINEDDIWGRAAQLSYFFLLALFPLLLFLTALLGYFAEAGTKLRAELLVYLGQVMPGSAVGLVHDFIENISQNKSGGKLSFGILAALWAASNGMGAISESLNIAYNVKETRPWWKARLTAILLTIALSILIISALVLVLYGGDIGEKIANNFGLSSAFTIAWKILQWPIALIFVLFGFSLIYYLAPDLHDQDWKWVTPGSVIGVALWLLVSFGFRAYLHFFDSYSATYGSLGAVIIMMLWFYLTGVAILIGGEINSEIENAAAEAGAADAKERGEKAPDENENKRKGGKKRTAKAK